MIKQYAVYRYGGKIKMDSIEKRHKTYSELLSEIDMYSKNPEYLHLMTQLKRFYEESPITQFAKNELLEIPRREIGQSIQCLFVCDTFKSNGCAQCRKK